jgi:HAMP domain-containing protein
VDFAILERISNVATFAVGIRIREIKRLRRAYGLGRWRKRKGVARVELSDGTTRRAALHWYEATGVGRYEYKIKRYLD